MAVKQIMDVDLIVVVDGGVDIMTGKYLYKNRYVSNVNREITPQQSYDSIVALMGLQKHPVYNIKQRESYELRGA